LETEVVYLLVGRVIVEEGEYGEYAQRSKEEPDQAVDCP
jgi:hypothetical protein